MEQFIKKHAEKSKFVLVGGFNTALDFSILFLLVAAGLNTYVANFISTGMSMVVSFFANKSFTFGDKKTTTKRQFILFIAITAFGLWAIQPAVIFFISAGLSSLGGNASFVLLVAKLVATLVSLAWNYCLYSRIVFKKESH